MPRGQYARKSKSAGTGLVLIPASTITTQKWFGKLNAEEQKSAMSETQLLANSLLKYGNARLEVGQHLTALQGILEPHNLFSRYLKTFHFSKKTAYRYIFGFKNAKAALPEPVLRVAMERNFDIIGYDATRPLGKYTAAVKALPPPAVVNEEQAATYLNQLEDVRKQNQTANISDYVPVTDPATIAKECYRFISLRLRRVKNARQKHAIINRVFGMVMADAGIQSAQSFAPQAVPEDFKAQRGAPRKLSVVAAA